tara:strand:+ start:464 stop:2071 length:1608 start_codon:yes stop_codon:yes gene_type:complete
MASTIKLKTSTSEGNVPASLSKGEVAINVADGVWYYGGASAVQQNFKFGSMTVTGDTSLDGKLVVTGNTVMNGTLSASSVNVGNGAGSVSAATITSSGDMTVGGDLDVDGVFNVDNMDIDGTFKMDGTTFDVNATTTLALDNTNTTNGVTINTVTSGSKVFIGHTVSETTVNDNLTVTGTLTMGSTAALTNAGLVSVAGQTNITSLGTLTELTVDNININASKITTTSGHLTIYPASGRQIQFGASGELGSNADVQFYSSVEGADMLWDESAGTLDVNAKLVVDSGNISLDSTSTLNIDNSNTSNGITIGTATSGVPIQLGHSTSNVHINDNLTVTGNTVMNGTLSASSVNVGNGAGSVSAATVTALGFVGTQHMLRSGGFYLNDNPMVQNSLYFGHSLGSQPNNFNDPQACGGVISDVASFTIIEDDMNWGYILPCDVSKVEVQCSLRPNLGTDDDFSLVIYTGIRQDNSNTALTLTKVAIGQTTFKTQKYRPNDVTYTGNLDKGTMIYVGVGSEDDTDAKNARGLLNIMVTQR